MCLVLPVADKKHTALLDPVNKTKFWLNGVLVKKPVPFAEKRVSFRFARTGIPGNLTFGEAGRSGVIHFPEIAGNFTDDYPKVVYDQPDPVVHAQVVLKEGAFGVEGGMVRWDLPKRLFPDAKPRAVAKKLYMDVKGFDSVELVVWDLNASTVPEATYEIRTTDNSGSLELEVSYGCKTLFAAEADADFVNHYKLLSPETQRRIDIHLANRPHPVPHKMGNVSARVLSAVRDTCIQFWGGRGGSGCNCLGCEGEPRSLEKLDRF
jgi:hypothetical protein